MNPTISIREALSDPQLLGGILAGDSWQTWRVLLIAAMGEELTDDERIVFTKLTGRERELLRRVEELVAVVGRRGGKSRAIATLIAYIAGLCKHPQIVPGEKGVVLCIAPDQRQAAIVLDYATAAFEQSPVLKQLVANRTADTLELTSGITIEVRSASFRRLRGPTYIACICDEAAFWYSDEFSANTDAEILNSVRPGLATTGGPLIVASSPYAKRGVLWEAHRRNFGKSGDAKILVAQGTSRDFNPLLPQRVIDRAPERDRASATAEYLAQFRNDIESFVSFEVVNSCLGDYVEMAPIGNCRYSAFVDPSGGSADSFTMAIAHRDGERAVIDAVREIQPPFSPEGVIDEFANLLKGYRISRGWSATDTRANFRESNSASAVSNIVALSNRSRTYFATCCHCSTPARSRCPNQTDLLISSAGLSGAWRDRARTRSTTRQAAMTTSQTALQAPPKQ